MSGDPLWILVTILAIAGARACIALSHRARGRRLSSLKESSRIWLNPGDRVALAPDAFCELIDVRPDIARLGIHVPKDTPILRTEFYDFLRSEQN